MPSQGKGRRRLLTLLAGIVLVLVLVPIAQNAASDHVPDLPAWVVFSALFALVVPAFFLAPVFEKMRDGRDRTTAQPKQIERAINDYRQRVLREVEIWHARGIFAQVADLYPTIEPLPPNWHLNLPQERDYEADRTYLSLRALLEDGFSSLDTFDAAEGRLVIVGEPGVGKTAQIYAAVRDLLLRGDGRHGTPFLVEANEVGDRGMSTTLVEAIALAVASRYHVDAHAVREELDAGSCVIVIDGIDEMPRGARSRLLDDLKSQLSERQGTRLLLGARREVLSDIQESLPDVPCVSLMPASATLVRGRLQGTDQHFTLLSAAKRNPEILELLCVPLFFNAAVLALNDKEEDASTEIARIGREELLRRLVQVAVKRVRVGPYRAEDVFAVVRWQARRLLATGDRYFIPDRPYAADIAREASRRRLLLIGVLLEGSILSVASAALLYLLSPSLLGSLAFAAAVMVVASITTYAEIYRVNGSSPYPNLAPARLKIERRRPRRSDRRVRRLAAEAAGYLALIVVLVSVGGVAASVRPTSLGLQEMLGLGRELLTVAALLLAIWVLWLVLKMFYSAVPDHREEMQGRSSILLSQIVGIGSGVLVIAVALSVVARFVYYPLSGHLAASTCLTNGPLCSAISVFVAPSQSPITGIIFVAQPLLWVAIHSLFLILVLSLLLTSPITSAVARRAALREVASELNIDQALLAMLPGIVDALRQQSIVQNIGISVRFTHDLIRESLGESFGSANASSL